MRAMMLLIVASMATPAIAADQNQFDLICSTRNIQLRYRVDLTAMEYCVGRCSTVSKIASVTSATLTLDDQKPGSGNDVEKRTVINRATNAWHASIFDPRFGATPFVRDGFCVSKAFSGIPKG